MLYGKGGEGGYWLERVCSRKQMKNFAHISSNNECAPIEGYFLQPSAEYVRGSRHEMPSSDVIYSSRNAV